MLVYIKYEWIETSEQVEGIKMEDWLCWWTTVGATGHMTVKERICCQDGEQLVFNHTVYQASSHIVLIVVYTQARAEPVVVTSFMKTLLFGPSTVMHSLHYLCDFNHVTLTSHLSVPQGKIRCVICKGLHSTALTRKTPPWEKFPWNLFRLCKYCCGEWN